MQKSLANMSVGVLTSLALSITESHAENYTFTNSVGSPFYSAGGNWDMGAVPGVNDNARFTNSATYTVGFSASAQNAKAVFDALGGSVTLGVSNSVWSLSDSVAVGVSAGANPGVLLNTGTLTVTNNGAGLLDVGTGGAGTFTIQGSGATSVVDRIRVTNVINGVGNSLLNLRYGVLTTLAGSMILKATNGLVDTGDFRVGPTNGNTVSMTWNIMGGTNLVNVPSAGLEGVYPGFMIGGNSGGLYGIVNVSGIGTVLTNYGGGWLMIGAGHNWSQLGNGGSGNNQLNITGGAVVFQAGPVYLGWPGRNNRLLVSGSNSLFSSSGTITISKSGGGNSVIVSNGAQFVSATVGVGEFTSGDNNLVLVSGTNSLMNVTSLYPSGNNNAVVVSNGATLCVKNTAGSPFVFGDHNGGGNSNKLIVTGNGSILTNCGSTAFLVSNDSKHGFFSNLLVKVDKGGAFYTGDLAIGGYHGDCKDGSNSVAVSTIVSDPQSLVLARTKILTSKYIWDKTVNLVITNGAAVVSQNAEIGSYPLTPTNFLPMGGSALVTGNGSVWSNQSDISLGTFTNSCGELTIRAGGCLVTSRVREGVHAHGTGTVAVADSGSVMLVTNTFYVGENGRGNLTVADGGLLAVTNTSASALLDIRCGTFAVANGGRVTVDKLTFTNTLDVLTFAAGSSGLGSVKVKGSLTLSAGSKLKIDLSNYAITPNQTTDVLTLFEYGTLPTSFNLANVQMIGNPKFGVKLTQGSGANDSIKLSVSRIGTIVMLN